jgi:hypothetical protein
MTSAPRFASAVTPRFKRGVSPAARFRGGEGNLPFYERCGKAARSRFQAAE